MIWFMLIKVADISDDLSLRPLLHTLLALILVPLLFVKVLIARYYKNYTNALVPLGLLIFTLAFVLVASTVALLPEARDGKGYFLAGD